MDWQIVQGLPGLHPLETERPQQPCDPEQEPRRFQK